MGRRPSCVRPVDANGDNILLLRINRGHQTGVHPRRPYFALKTELHFDLVTHRRAAEWEAIKNCFLISPSRDARDERGDYLIDGTRDPNSRQPRYGRAELYVEMPGMFAERRLPPRINLSLKPRISLHLMSKDIRTYN
jgi:hypothetical protein